MIVTFWLARSPDLTSMNFTMWDDLKSFIRQSEIILKNDLKEKILNAYATLKVDKNMMQHLRNEAIKRAKLLPYAFSNLFFFNVVLFEIFQ